MADPNDPVTINYLAIYTKGVQAIANNAAFLAIPTPTQAQTVAQVQLLTRECTAIMRLLVNQLDTTDGI